MLEDTSKSGDCQNFKQMYNTLSPDNGGAITVNAAVVYDALVS